MEEFAHQVYIGVENNTKSGVRTATTPQPIVEVQTVGILNCAYSVSFWISWSGSERRVGLGTIVGWNPFLTWVDESSNLVATVGFSNAHQTDSHYLIRRNAGRNVSLKEDLAFTIKGAKLKRAKSKERNHYIV